MSIVTKAIAKEVAERMLTKKADEIKNLINKRDFFILCICRKNIKKEILDFYNKHKDYVRSTNQVTLNDNGFHGDYFYLNERIPSKNSSTMHVSMSVKDSKELLPLIDEIDGLEKQYKSLKIDIENALLSLKTYKKVSEEFKEAYGYLPNKISTSLVINIDKIREKL